MVTALDATLGEFMQHHHDDLEQLLERVMTAIDDDDQYGALRAWRPFEAGILRHFASEEKLLFPRLEKTDLNETEHLQAEHGALRKSIADLGMQLELHTAKKLAFDQFAALLERHVEREEALLYNFAERRVPKHIGALVRKQLACAIDQTNAILHEHPALRSAAK